MFSPLALLSGLLAGAGSGVLQQQYGVLVLTRGALVRWVVIGLAVAVVVPSIGRAVGVARYNRALRRAGLA